MDSQSSRTTIMLRLAQHYGNCSPTMKFEWNIFVAALGLALVIEGLPYFIAPEAVKRMAARMGEIPGGVLRVLGLISIVIGLAIVAVARLYF